MAYKKYGRKGGRVAYGKPFRSRKGRYGKYKYLNGKKVAFIPVKKSYSRKRR